MKLRPEDTRYLVWKRGRWLAGFRGPNATWDRELFMACEFLTLSRAQHAARRFAAEVAVLQPQPLHGAGFAPPRMVRVRAPRSR